MWSVVWRTPLAWHVLLGVMGLVSLVVLLVWRKRGV